MSDTESAPTATPGAGKSVKFANPRQVGAMFPAFQSRCSIQKGLLTKALNSVKSSKDEFCQAMEGNSSALTKKRKAEEFVDRVSNVSVRKSQLEDAYDKLVEHCYELSETDFEPVTAPQVMAEYLNRQMLELISTADSTMIRYEDKVRDGNKTEDLQRDSLNHQRSSRPVHHCF